MHHRTRLIHPVDLTQMTLVNDDSLSHLPTLQNGLADCVITDPPYETNVHEHQTRIRKDSDGGISLRTEKFELPFAPMSQEMRILLAMEFVRLTKRWIVVFSQAEAVGDWKRAIEYAHGVFKRTCIWVKPNAQPQLSGDRPAQGFESIVCAYSHPGRSEWNGGGKVGLYYALHDQFRHHPTQKPLELMTQLVKDFSNPGELILDPFMGSGSTGIAAKILGRNFYGVEADLGYYSTARNRILYSDTVTDKQQMPLFSPSP